MQSLHVTRLALVLITLLTIVSMTTAQSENLLDNPGFEAGFRDVPSLTDASVANEWQAWVSDDSNAPSFQFAPFYVAASAANPLGIPPRVRSGSDAQVYFSQFSTHDAGVYQQVSGLSSGTELRFSIYAYVFSNSLNDLDISEQPGGVALRVGIDPTGGTDPLSDDVEYSEAAIFYDAYRQYSIIAEAEASTVTVFVRTTVADPVANSIVYLDDAVLEITPESDATDEPTDVPTSTPTNTATPTPTATDVPSSTPTDVPTDEPTDEPTDVPTNTPTAVPTDEPTAAPPTEDGVDPTPTREQLPEASATATTSVNVPTATPSGDATEEAPITDEFPGEIIHTVASGDTVGNLARFYDSSINAIIRANGLTASAFIQVGQNLIIPIRASGPDFQTATPTPIAPTATPVGDGGGVIAGDVYVVQRGDTLNDIASFYNTTVGTLVQLNGIANPNRIIAGQELRLPLPASTPVQPQPGVTAVPVQPTVQVPPPEQQVRYTVQPGDTLYRIALRFNVSLVQLAQINDINNVNFVFTGQVLILPPPRG